jgi:hypothetical protein
MLLRLSFVPMRRWILSVASVLALIGFVLVAIGSMMPAYSEPKAAQLIFSGAECVVGVPNPDPGLVCADDVWTRSMASLQTGKWRYLDAGMGLLASALTLVVFGWYCRRVGWEAWADLKTPRRAGTFVILASICWFVQIPAQLVSLFVAFTTRDCCPWWADSMIIPMVEIPMVGVALFFPYLAIWVCLWLGFLFRSRLPAPFFLIVPERKAVTILWTVATLVLAAPLMLYLGYTVLNGPTLMVPFLWLSLWLVLCLRAAALSRSTLET